MATAASKSLLRDALSATSSKDKGPPVADGILSITPDTPEVVEWRRSALDITETTSTYLDDDDDVGPKPHELYGKFTWKIENFSETSKRELRSNVFDVGNYKWYILVYPQGCDVCNHLSLFLCVADYDKLLPGWSHFAQFTIAVVNKDPKKSKYSDTLHRFCKKEHDWGWKKFMELSKVLDGFTVADTLVIKAQVQVILDKPNLPFRCLDPQYRRELVRVYLTNVEGVCRRFCDDKKLRLSWVKEEVKKFKDFWVGLSSDQQRKLLAEKADGILKGLVKQFFNEKEVTSTLVMDALYSGCKQVEEHSRLYMEGKSSDNLPLVLIKAERNAFALLGDLLELADRVSKDFIPMAKDDKQMVQPNDGLALRSGQEDDYRRDSIERDEKRLAELGRKTVEMFVISHIITDKMEIAYRDAEALKRQDLLIAEEFEMQQMEESKAKVQAEKEKEKKAKKKEKAKAKKEADKAKKDAEEQERKNLEDQKRVEAEKRAQEAAAAEKKRQEEEQQAKAKQQAAATARQVQQQAASASSKQQQQQGKGKIVAPSNAAAGAIPSSTQAPQQQRAAVLAKVPYVPAVGHQASTATAGKQQQAMKTVALSASPVIDMTQELTSSSTGTEERLDSALSDTDDSSKEVGTVDQATGVNADTEEEEEDAESEDCSTADAAVAALASAEARASAAEQEVLVLRCRVRALEKQLAERDAELYALQVQLTELQPTELADVFRRRPAGHQQHSSSDSISIASSVMVNGNNGKTLNRVASEKDTTAFRHGDVPSSKAEHIASGNGPMTHPTGPHKEPQAPPPPPPPPPPSAVNAGGAGNQASSAGSRRTAAGAPPYDPTGRLAPQQQRAGTTTAAASDTCQVILVRGASSSSAMYNLSAAAGPAAANGARAGVAGPGQQQGKQGTAAPVASTAHQYGIVGSNGVTNAVGATVPGQAVHNSMLSSTLSEPAVPSYRNAAVAGGGLAVTAGAPAPPTAAGTAMVASSVAPHQRAQTPMGGQASSVTPAKQKHQSLDEPSTPTAAPSLAVQQQQQQQQRGHLNHAAAEFTAGPHLIMHQQPAQQTGLTYGAGPAKRAQQSVTPQMESPGLDDFAHMGLIDDLLTE
ncbi:hypothetical protein CEUSTIGMA_g7596.t1 [Chlamydomonas eustigma]|uniref:MATH domain-containing protein n=1 Tax=Chlamydomonas eustigma TaxID=1157962 RepID=A0A250XAQ2_9CHLO|nr:hypothetical protein CEUSTIGMA_g7596.t1 [Chlamydomonas eustigma]|eukprot:GAX80158.1 hypothetical protein CEUSTIGMA_g7596.t1 [Chlamydomonas eustigma]